jgi:trans-2,3-dihydro-3-hydroxyanthranilate isomerase
VTRVEYRLVDVFTRERFGGNPLAVFLDGRGIEPALMQRIAFELNLSETAFVLPTERPDCDVRVRIFTPRAELPMAGHPTVGTAFVLDERERSERNRIIFELGVGPVPVERLYAADGATLWRMTQPPARFGPRCDDRAALAVALGLDAADLDPMLPCESVATGPAFLIVPLLSLEALARARLRIDAWERIERAVQGAQPYLFVRTGESTARCRMFGPGHGIAEDPATGGAAGPLGAYWLAHGLTRPNAPLVFTQGVEMGRPSEILVEVDTSVRVAGACVPTGGGWFDL